MAPIPAETRVAASLVPGLAETPGSTVWLAETIRTARSIWRTDGGVSRDRPHRTLSGHTPPRNDHPPANLNGGQDEPKWAWRLYPRGRARCVLRGRYERRRHASVRQGMGTIP